MRISLSYCRGRIKQKGEKRNLYDESIVKSFTNSVICLSLLAILLGVVLIAHAVFNIDYMLVVKKNAKDVEKLIVEKLNMIDAEAANVVEVEESAEAEAEAEDEDETTEE